MRSRSVVLGVAAAAAVAAAVYAAYWYGTRQGGHAPEPSAASAGDRIDPKTGRRVLYWHDPMVPGQKFDKPGKSPFMDMDLVPVYADEAGAQGTVSVDPRVVQNLGVRTAEVARGALAAKIEAVGNVAFNERELVQVQARVGGFVERLRARAPLERVRKGQPLVELLSPDWIAVQEDYLALRRMPAPDAQLVDAARQRMRLVGMDEAAIQRVESTGETQPRSIVVAPVDGVVAELGVREGMTVTAGATLFRINGLASVWVNAEIPSAATAGLKPGLAVSAKSSTYPDKAFAGRISALLPQVNTTTRTVIARIELANPGGLLVPGMFVNVDLSSIAKKEALLVPSEAVIQTGTRSVVVLALGEGRFRPVEVDTGAEAGGRTEILKGLEAGQTVVVSGQFLIDSEASLKGAVARMEGSAGRIHGAAGKVVAIGAQETTIEHGPVPSLQWDGMTMAFRNPAAGLPKEIKPGDEVSFEFRQTKEGEFEITGIRRIAPAKAAK